MATKNIEFTKRLINLIKDSGLDNKEFAREAGLPYPTLMTYIGPKGGRVPEWDQLVKISAFSHVSIDWLLGGEQRLSPQLYDWPEDMRRGCKQFQKIMRSDNEIIKNALISNLAAFEVGVDNAKRLAEAQEQEKRLEKRVRSLEKAMFEGPDCGIDAAASSNTAKSKT